jgi:uncharacterized protein (DUF486 family)
MARPSPCCGQLPRSGALGPHAGAHVRRRDGVGHNRAFGRNAGMNASTLPAHPALACAVLLTCSNVFMTFAWYGHLRNLADRSWWYAAIVSWGIALFEYLLQVPANRIGYTALSLGQLKIMQEVITLSVFVPFAYFYMDQPVKLDYVWAALCMMGAVYFVFRG